LRDVALQHPARDRAVVAHAGGEDAGLRELTDVAIDVALREAVDREHLPDRREVVLRREALRDAGELEEEDVPALLHLPPDEEVPEHDAEVRDVQDREPLEHRLMDLGEAPRDDAAPVVPDDVRAIAAERSHEARDVAGGAIAA